VAIPFRCHPTETRQKPGLVLLIIINDLEGEHNVELKEKVEQSLNKVRPALQADGGDVKLLEVTDDGIVRLSLTGACAGCPMSTMTLKMGIERKLMEDIPEVKAVESV
jgi:Fe-S cluster biogenesis protein NfuA